MPLHIKKTFKKPTNNSTVKKPTHYWPIAIALGIILCLAGLFLALAAYQIIPNGVNAISDLGVWGQVAGYGLLGAGFVIMLVGAIKWYLNKKNAHDNSEPDASDTRYNAAMAAMKDYLPHRLKSNELLVVDNPSKKEITVYYWEGNVVITGARPATPDTLAYREDATPEEAFEGWNRQHAGIAQGKTFIDLDTLRGRIESLSQYRG